jgi:hypothetical protein
VSPGSAKSAFSSNSGVSKRKKKTEMSRNQKLRAQKAMEKADILADRMEIKVKRSEGKSKVIQSRSKEWTDVNAKAESGKSLGFEILKDEVDDDQDQEIKPALPTRFGNDTEVPLDLETQEPLALPLRSLDIASTAKPESSTAK